jgi:response regulator RpfG family c-di-GMP phosphodiesterase
MDIVNAPQKRHVHGPARLLVVDDDRDVCELVGEVFDALPDVQVTSCTDPRDALEHIAHRPIDLVLTDLFMGQFSGMDVLQATLHHHPDAVVILMTGQPSVENALDAMKQGAYDYLLKPFDIHSLRRIVERGIERRRLWLENAHLTETVALYQLSHAATSNVDTQELFDLTLNAIQAEFGPDWSAIFAFDVDQSLVTASQLGDPGVSREVDFYSGLDPQSLEALGTAEPVVQRLLDPDAVKTTAARTVYGYRVSHPIAVNGRVAGLINFQCPPRPEPLNSGDLKTLAILANQLGAAMENRRLVDRLQSSYIDMVYALASALDARDRNTRDHTDRVCHLAECIALELGWSQEKLPELWLGCVLHDIGKIGVPDTILQKPGPLTAEEFELMKTHTVCGTRIVESIPYLKPAIPYILHHHEKFDGTGYPHGLKGREIPEEARLLAVVDTFDAIISDRPYRKGRSVAVALAEIQAFSGTQFDPTIVDAFMRAWSSGRVDRRDLDAPARSLDRYRQAGQVQTV